MSHYDTTLQNSFTQTKEEHYPLFLPLFTHQLLSPKKGMIFLKRDQKSTTSLLSLAHFQACSTKDFWKGHDNNYRVLLSQQKLQMVLSIKLTQRATQEKSSALTFLMLPILSVSRDLFTVNKTTKGFIGIFSTHYLHLL